MELLKPFCGLRPSQEFAENVIAPPYDVVTKKEAQARAQNNPCSFLHISRPEIDCQPTVAVDDPIVYELGARQFEQLIEQGILQKEDAEAFYVYRITQGEHVQTGVLALVSTKAYDKGLIKRHELTREDKETDRVNHMLAQQGHSSPLLLSHHDQSEIANKLNSLAVGKPTLEATLDTVLHQVWVIQQPEDVEFLATHYNDLQSLYIADGHHRTAAASRVASKLSGGAEYFLGALFPCSELVILGYHRVVSELNGLTAEQFLNALSELGNMEAHSQAVEPTESNQVGIYLQNQWYCLTINDFSADVLPADWLAKNIIDPLLGIKDIRRDKRINFIGGKQGVAQAESAVNAGDMQLALILPPTCMEQIMAVSDANGIMPPKSTWFEPKLADGLLSYRF